MVTVEHLVNNKMFTNEVHKISIPGNWENKLEKSFLCKQ